MYSLLDRITDFCGGVRKENLYNLLVRVEDPWKYNNETLYRSLIHEMADFGEDERETVYSLVVEMADVLERINKKKLYSSACCLTRRSSTMKTTYPPAY